MVLIINALEKKVVFLGDFFLIKHFAGLSSCVKFCGNRSFHKNVLHFKCFSFQSCF